MTRLMRGQQPRLALSSLKTLNHNHQVSFPFSVSLVTINQVANVVQKANFLPCSKAT